MAAQSLHLSREHFLRAADELAQTWWWAPPNTLAKVRLRPSPRPDVSGTPEGESYRRLVTFGFLGQSVLNGASP